MAPYEDWACFARTAKVGPFAFLECRVATQIGHSQGRLTECDDLTRAIARVDMLEQLWGTDMDFLRSHGDTYQRVIDQQRTRKAHGLIMAGRPVEARAELARVQGVPAKKLLLLTLPARVPRTAAAIQRVWWAARPKVVAALPPRWVKRLKSIRRVMRRG